MTPETTDPYLHSTLIWTIIIASFTLSALAAGMSVYMARRLERRDLATRGFGQELQP